jgi:hypothetical protein
MLVSVLLLLLPLLLLAAAVDAADIATVDIQVGFSR